MVERPNFLPSQDLDRRYSRAVTGLNRTIHRGGDPSSSMMNVEKWMNLWKTGNMFAGFRCRMDRQGRVAIPSAFRRKIEDSGDSSSYSRSSTTPSPVIPVEPGFLSKNKCFPARLLQGAVVVARSRLPGPWSRLDTQGRILVPPTLRRLADLDRDVVVIGQWTASRSGHGPNGALRQRGREALLNAASTEAWLRAGRPSTVKPRLPLAFASLRLTVRMPWPRVAVENIGQKWPVWAGTCCAVTILHE